MTQIGLNNLVYKYKSSKILDFGNINDLAKLFNTIRNNEIALQDVKRSQRRFESNLQSTNL